MSERMVKVDRVRSVAEAATLEAFGVDIIGVDFDPDPRFSDDRTIGAAEIRKIRDAVRGVRLAVAVSPHREPADVTGLLQLTGADLLQPTTSVIPSPAVRGAVRDAGIGIVYGGIEVSHDDDPGWVFSAHDDEADLGAVLFQVDVLPEYRNSWAFLRDESPEFENEMQIEDLDQLARSHPMLITLDFTPENLGEITARLPHVRGISLVLAERATRNDTHFHSFSDAVKVLESRIS